MKTIQAKLLLAIIAFMPIANSAMAGTLSVIKQTHSQQGLVGVSSPQRSENITYTVEAEYSIDDTITFTFSDGSILQPIPTGLTATAGNPDNSGFSLELVNSDPGAFTYRVSAIAPSTTNSTVGASIAFGAISFSTSAILSQPLFLTVSSQTADGESMDVDGTRTATVAETKSQFGSLVLSSSFDNIIDNNEGSDSTSFTDGDTDTITWVEFVPFTLGWLNLATVMSTSVTIEGDPGSMTEFGNANFSAAGTQSFNPSTSAWTTTYNGMSLNDTMTFTTAGTAALVAQHFRMSLAYNYSSAAGVNGTHSVTDKISVGVWALAIPSAISTLPTANVAFNYQNNTLNGAFCDLDDVLDPGETAMMTVWLKNTGADLLSDIQAQVSTTNATADITFANNGIITFSDIPVSRDRDSMASAMLEVTLNNAEINEAIDITVTFSSNSGAPLPEPITTTLNVNRDYTQNRASEDFSSAATVWMDWQRSEETSITEDAEHALTRWEVVNDNDLGFIAYGPNLSAENDISLISPVVSVEGSGEFTMAFDHYFEFEAGSWDGGVIELSIDGDDWTDIVDAGGTFAAGYNGTISSANPSLGDRPGFVDHSSYAVSMTAETLTFADGILNGKEVQFRFRIGTDNSISDRGWNIANVSFTNITNATPFTGMVVDSGVCANRAPFLNAVTGTENAIETSEVTLTAEGQDHDSDSLIYIWTQIAGTTTVNRSTNATLTFDAPNVESDETYSFSVVSNDGTTSSDPLIVSVLITANAVPEITATETMVTIGEGETVTLSVSGSDGDGDSLTYEWMMNGRALSVTGNSYEFTASDASQDSVFFSVTASDGMETSAAAEIDVTVTENTAPTLTTNQSSLTVEESEAVTLSVTGSDAEGDTLSYQWTQDGVALSETGNSFTFTSASINEDTTVVFRVTASDGRNTSAPVVLVVSVENKSSGGGGSMGWFVLLLGALSFVRLHGRGKYSALLKRT
ncbi:MAG: hypothetical protein COA42_17275 [Alteromonadaceae bacterium]|nr:MAG: hypothetical protein COA42_17275 [Alteromonadaceae bacterium]